MKLKVCLCAIAAATALSVLATLPRAARADDKAAATQAATTQQAVVNAKCPITGEDVDAKVTTTHDGKTYAFCCSDCIATFQKDPAKYAAKAK